jgi:hypothetical protein
MDGVRVVKSEQFTPNLQIAHGNGEIKSIVNIYRDFRDVVISGHDFHRARARYYAAYPYHAAEENRNDPKFMDEDWWTMERSIEMAERWLTWQKAWESIPDIYSSKYEDIFPDGWAQEALRIAEHLGVEINDPYAEYLSQLFSVEANEYRIASQQKWWDWKDEKLTRGHISMRRGQPGAWRTRLTKQQILAIEDMAGDWLEEHGYEKATSDILDSVKS